MKLWNVILATLVIFGAGVLTGALAVNITSQVQAIPPAVAPAGKQPQQRIGIVLNPRDREFLGRLNAQLVLDTNQFAHVEQILKESNDRIKKSLKEEARVVREKIQAELTEDQRKKFGEDQIKMPRGHKPDEKPRKNQQMRTNNPNAGSSSD